VAAARRRTLVVASKISPVGGIVLSRVFLCASAHQFLDTYRYFHNYDLYIRDAN
jgi:hypothetical protein